MQPIYSMQSTYLVFYIAEHGKILDRIISRFDGGIRRKNINLSSNHWVLIPIMFDIGYVLR